ASERNRPLAGRVDPLAVLQQTPARRPKQGEQVIDRREAAYSARITILHHVVVEAVRISPADELEHLLIGSPNPLLDLRRDAERVTKLGPDVGQIGPRDEADAPIAPRQHGAQRA